MNETIDKIIKAIQQAFDMGTKAVQDLYPVLRQEWVIDRVSNIMLVVFSILACLSLALVVAAVLYNIENEIEIKDLEKEAIKTKGFIVALIISVIAIIACLIIPVIYAADYKIFLQLIENSNGS